MDFNLAAVHEAIAGQQPEAPCIAFRDLTLSWAEVTGRTRRLANHLHSAGLGAVQPRSTLPNWASGQDHVALYLHNGNEYLEGMLGAFKARCAPLNVNYRYVRGELNYLLRDAGARAIIYHARFAGTLAEVLPKLPALTCLLQVDDGSGVPLLPGAVDYERALRAASPARPALQWSPDDLYILYTGGTTGMPKGVMWRQADLFIGALGGAHREGRAFSSMHEVCAQVAAGHRPRVCAPPPMMHGAAHWAAFHAWHAGGCVVIQDHVRSFEAAKLWRTLARQRAESLVLVGDAFGRPLVEALERGATAAPSLHTLINSGAALSVGVKRRLLACMPQLRIVDAVGSSESGQQGVHISHGDVVDTGRFVATPGTRILSEDLSRVLVPPTGTDDTADDTQAGWFAKRGPMPLGYLGDAKRTRATFPTIDGVRYAVPGDRARFTGDGDGTIELLGRDSVTINTGGEKVYAEEVEAALVEHPAVDDAVVCGCPSERWGQVVSAVIQPAPGEPLDLESLRDACATRLARYKLPKQARFVEHIVRSPSGKADYRWARAQFET